MANDNDTNFSSSNGTSSSGSSNSGGKGLFAHSGGQKGSGDPDEIDLKRLFFTLWNHKWKIIGSVLICTMLAGLFAFTATPIYRSEGSILISQQQSSFSDSDLTKLLTSTYGIGMGSTISNELQVLRSRNLSMAMADTLMEIRLMKNGRQYPVLFSGYPEDSTMAAKDSVAFRLRKKMSFSRADQEADLVNIAYESPSPLEARKVVDLTMELYTQLSTQQNRRSANAAVQFLKNERKRVKSDLTSVEDRLRQFMNKEQLVQVDAQTKELITHIAELEAKKQEAKVKLVAVESGIEQHKQRLNKIKPGLAEQYADAVGPNMVRLQYQLAELEIEKTQLLANNPSLKNTKNPPQELQRINEKIEVYRGQIRERTKKLMQEGDQYLGFLGGSEGNIAEAVTELNKKLIELQVEQEQYSAQLDVINTQLKDQKKFFQDLPDNMIKLARLKRDVKINEKLFITISQQYAEMSLWKETQFGKGRPLDHGFIPEKPIKPNKKLYLLVGFILGGILSVGYIFVRESFNTKIDGVEKLRKYNYPVLAVIPTMDNFIDKEYNGEPTIDMQGSEVSTSMVTLLDTISPLAESFRRLQNNIIYSNPDQSINSLVMTSSTKGEGKTTTISNLGAVLAEAGYSVLIVDLDLRRPALHDQFGLRRSPGMAELLFESATREEAIQTGPLANLSVLSAGHEPPNPAAVMQSEACLDMIRELEQLYDYVLIDTPPYGIISDASPLIKQTDGVIAVSRFDETTETELTHLLEHLEHIEADVIGTVLTAFDYTKASDYHYTKNRYRKIDQDYKSYHSAE